MVLWSRKATFCYSSKTKKTKTNAHAATLFSGIICFVYHPITVPNQVKKWSFSVTLMCTPSFSRAPFPTFLLLLMTVCLLVKVRKIWHWWECKRGEEKVRGSSLTPVNTDLGSILPLGCLQQANYQCSVTEKDKNTGWLKQIMHCGSTSTLLFIYLKA